MRFGVRWCHLQGAPFKWKFLQPAYKTHTRFSSNAQIDGRDLIQDVMISKIPKDLSKAIPSHSHSICAWYSTTAFSVFKSFNLFGYFNTYLHNWRTATMLKKERCTCGLNFYGQTRQWRIMILRVIHSVWKLVTTFYYFNWHTYQWRGFSEH
jgi:hypothetical protein